MSTGTPAVETDPTGSTDDVSRLVALWVNPVSVADLASAAADHADRHPELGPLLLVPTVRGAELRTAGRTCGCYTCVARDDEVAAGAGGWPTRFSMMIVCEACGNKRCPHASDHANACTASNVAGQRGSRYGASPKSA